MRKTEKILGFSRRTVCGPPKDSNEDDDRERTAVDRKADFARRRIYRMTAYFRTKGNASANVRYREQDENK